MHGISPQNRHRVRAVETELTSQNVQQPPRRPARVATLMLQVFHLLDRHTQPPGKLGLGHTDVLAQSHNTTGSPFHRVARGNRVPPPPCDEWVTKFAPGCNSEIQENSNRPRA